MQINSKMTETLENGYLSESTQRELSNWHQNGRVKITLSKVFAFLRLMEESSLSIGRLKLPRIKKLNACVTNLFKVC